MLVNVVLVGFVVVAGDALPVVHAKEGMLLLGQVTEVVVGLVAANHAETPPGLGAAHVAVSVLVITGVVVFEGLAELATDPGAVVGAAYDVVSLVDGSLAGTVEKTRGELGLSVLGQGSRGFAYIRDSC